MKILGLETSCDETAAAILEIKNGSFNLLSNIVSSQVKIHAKYGGIVPEVAGRKQMEMIMPVLEQALKQADLKKYTIDYIAVTQGPGLITSLTVGVETAKALAFAINKPLIFVNHLSGHIYSSLLKNSLQKNNFQKLERIKYPTVALVVSGGHTMLVLIKKIGQYKIIGETLDDAVGEAFDKAAKILGLGYPGGPIIAKLAADGNATKFNLPRPMIKSPDFNFSFSGLKTALLYLVQDLKKQKKLSKQTTKDICSSFELACVDVLTAKTLSALKKFQPRTFILGGGVAANQSLRQALEQKISTEFPKIKILRPEIKFTGDNAAMIALAGYYKIKEKLLTPHIKKPKDFLMPPLQKGRTYSVDYKKIKAEPNLKLQ